MEGKFVEDCLSELAKEGLFRHNWTILFNSEKTLAKWVISERESPGLPPCIHWFIHVCQQAFQQMCQFPRYDLWLPEPYEGEEDEFEEPVKKQRRLRQPEEVDDYLNDLFPINNTYKVIRWGLTEMKIGKREIFAWGPQILPNVSLYDWFHIKLKDVPVENMHLTASNPLSSFCSPMINVPCTATEPICVIALGADPTVHLTRAKRTKDENSLVLSLASFFHAYADPSFMPTQSLENLNVCLSTEVQEAVKEHALTRYTIALRCITRNLTNANILNQFRNIKDLATGLIVESNLFNIPLMYSHPITKKEIRLAFNPDKKVTCRWTNLTGEPPSNGYVFDQSIRHQLLIGKSQVEKLALETLAAEADCTLKHVLLIFLDISEDVSIEIEQFGEQINLQEVATKVKEAILLKELESFRTVGVTNSKRDILFNGDHFRLDSSSCTKEETKELTALNHTLGIFKQARIPIEALYKLDRTTIDIVATALKKDLSQVEFLTRKESLQTALRKALTSEQNRSLYLEEDLKSTLSSCLLHTRQPAHEVFTGKKRAFYLIGNCLVYYVENYTVYTITPKNELELDSELTSMVERYHLLQLSKSILAEDQSFFVHLAHAAPKENSTNTRLVNEFKENLVTFAAMYNIHLSNIVTVTTFGLSGENAFNHLISDSFLSLTTPYSTGQDMCLVTEFAKNANLTKYDSKPSFTLFVDGQSKPSLCIMKTPDAVSELASTLFEFWLVGPRGQVGFIFLPKEVPMDSSTPTIVDHYLTMVYTEELKCPQLSLQKKDYGLQTSPNPINLNCPLLDLLKKWTLSDVDKTTVFDVIFNHTKIFLKHSIVDDPRLYLPTFSEKLQNTLPQPSSFGHLENLKVSSSQTYGSLYINPNEFVDIFNSHENRKGLPANHI